MKVSAFILIASLAAVTCHLGCAQQITPVAKGPTIVRCQVLPADSIWNTPIDTAPVHRNSQAYVASIGVDRTLHPDFGKDSKSGIPFNVVGSSQARVSINVSPDESETSPVPIPPQPFIEGGNDAHLIVLDQDACKLYELYAAKPRPDGTWEAGSVAHFDLNSNSLRPDGWTSADAAGLPIFPGLVRYEEVAAGEIRHAIRFTALQTQRAYVWPARHFASRSTDAKLPPMGTRMRLRADLDISGFSRETQVILKALKKYGMILADNGSPWFISGAPNEKWNPELMTQEMRRIKGSDFIAVDTSAYMASSSSGRVLKSTSSANERTTAAAKVPTIGKCGVFPPDNAWNTPVNKLPTHRLSEAYMKNIGLDKPLHADFGSDPASGIPINLVSGTQPKVAVRSESDESDTGLVPIPNNPLREGGADSHVVVVDTDNCHLHELYDAKQAADGSWAVGSYAFFDLRSNALRPDGWTSADAAGLPIFPGLVRYEEVAAGEIRHAIRFTTLRTQRSYIWPARHFASRSEDTNLPPMGLRLRLKSAFDVSKFSVPTQVILRALQTYGMILADNGSPLFITGSPNPNWKPEEMAVEMRRVTGADFEAVDTESGMRGQNSAAVLPPTPQVQAVPSQGSKIGSCTILPADNIFNTPVDKLPVSIRSGAYVASIGADKPLHPDFANDPASGIPINVVTGKQPKVPVTAVSPESDSGPAPIPDNPRQEGGTDSHVIVLDTDNCRLYEFYQAKRNAGGAWQADSAAYYDLRSNALRPDGWTSADAAGLPILPGLVRYEEVASGEIRHAIRFTAPATQRVYIWPARHFASRSDNRLLPPMGLRMRLRANFDVTSFSPHTQVILRALKKYGMILADNGSPWFISGAPHQSWNPDQMTEEMRRVRGSDFEAVDTADLMQGPNSGAARQVSRIANAASGLGTSVAAGEAISIHAEELSADTSTGVRFDGQPAPILYSGQGQLNTLVPVHVQGSTRLEVASGDELIFQQDIPVSAAAPGVFTADATGVGQAIAINSDGSVNGLSTPSRKGSSMAIFVTGSGASESVEGSTKVHLNGVPIPVVSVRNVPDLLGVTRVEIAVPLAADSGTLSMLLQSGEAFSQPDVTVQVL